MKDLKVCPFCGKTETLRIVPAIQNNIQDVDPAYKTVCCSVNSGGYGSSCGYQSSESLAVESWNERVKE